MRNIAFFGHFNRQAQHQFSDRTPLITQPKKQGIARKLFSCLLVVSSLTTRRPNYIPLHNPPNKTLQHRFGGINPQDFSPRLPRNNMTSMKFDGASLPCEFTRSSDQSATRPQTRLAPQRVVERLVNRDEARLEKTFQAFDEQRAFDRFVQSRVETGKAQLSLDEVEISLDQAIRDRYGLDEMVESMSPILVLSDDGSEVNSDLTSDSSSDNSSSVSSSFSDDMSSEDRSVHFSDETQINERSTLPRKTKRPITFDKALERNSKNSAADARVEQANGLKRYLLEQQALVSLKKRLCVLMSPYSKGSTCTREDISELFAIPEHVVNDEAFPDNLTFADFGKNNWAENSVTFSSFLRMNQARKAGSKETWQVIDAAVRAHGRDDSSTDEVSLNQAKQAHLEYEASGCFEAEAHYPIDEICSVTESVSDTLVDLFDQATRYFRV